MKIAVALLVFAAFLFLGIYLKYNSELPTGTTGTKAEELATKISTQIGLENYKQTHYLSWQVRNFTYQWNKKNEQVIVKWDNNHVVYHTKNSEASDIISPINTSAKEKNKLINTAKDRFNNDSFWLVAPFKLFDPNVERKFIEATDTENASLLVTYNGGGTTPGDSYQWFVDENYRPTHFKMWVQIIPIGGLPASWEDWKNTETGFQLSHKKQILNFIPFPIENIKAWNTP